MTASWRRTATSLPHTCSTPGAQRAEVVDELLGDAALGLAGQHEHGSVEVAEQLDHPLEVGPVDRAEGRLHVGDHRGVVQLERLLAVELPDPFDGRTQLAAEIALHRRLQRREPVEAELGRQPDHRGRAGRRLGGEIGHGAEGHELRPLEHHLRHPSLGRRELRPGGADPLDDFQTRQPRHLGEGRFGHRGDTSAPPDGPGPPLVILAACSCLPHPIGPSPATTRREPTRR